MAKKKEPQTTAEVKKEESGRPIELLKGARLMDAVRDELAENEDVSIDALGQIMTAYLRRNPGAEAPSDRTLKGAMESMRTTARQKARGGSYAMPFTEGYELLMKHYGFEIHLGEAAACMLEMCNVAEEGARESPATAPEADALDLDALLEGL